MEELILMHCAISHLSNKLIQIKTKSSRVESKYSKELNKARRASVSDMYRSSSYLPLVQGPHCNVHLYVFGLRSLQYTVQFISSSMASS
jgi:hypothetical protein